MSLKAEAISKRSGNTWDLRDVSFEAAAGEVFGIFGTRDSGLAALTRLLDGSDTPNGGRLLLDSTELLKNPAPEGRISRLGGEPKRRLFGLLPSGGQQIPDVRSIIDAASGSTASVVLADTDLLSKLAPEEKQAVFEGLRNAALNHDICVLLTTNNFADILSACDRAAVLVGGELAQIGTPEELYASPESLEVARSVGRCNIFEARRISSSKADVPEFQLITGGHRLIAGRTEKAKLGALNRNVKLAVRPEHVSISFGASFPEDNLLKAVVTEVRFLGPNTLVRLDAEGTAMDALVMRLVGLNPGEECMIGMPPERIMIFA
ncbi:MAG: TOBE domain-containing protein [Pyrinomonadaceae bacterium]